MKRTSFILAAMVISSLNLQAINWPWGNKQESVPISQNPNTPNKIETESNKPKPEEVSASEKLDKIIRLAESLEGSIESKLVSKLSTIESKIDAKDREAFEALATEKEKLDKEITNIKIKIPLDVFERYKVPINLTEAEKKRLEEQETVKTLVRALVGLLAFIILILAISHSHRKADLLSWLNQRTWGRRTIFFTQNYGVMIFCIWEVVGNYNNVFEVADWIRRMVGLRF